MIYSKSGLALTESFEGFRQVAYQDSVGVWTVGYGHIRGVQAGLACTKAQAEQWLRTDIGIAQTFVNTHVKKVLTQGEFDALVDFAFNLGVGSENGSHLLALVNQGEFAKAALEFPRWDRAGGHEVAGLLRRRLAEEALFTA